MAKFMNKKEQVFDLKLTSYGHYLMSIGKFKPAFYSFYDDNVIYDKKYAHSSAVENQNNIHDRIKINTQYVESLVLFRDVEETLNNGEGASDWYNQLIITPRQQVPTKDIFKMDAPLGDALIEGDSNKAPAWKVIALQSNIDTVSENDNSNNSIIPQINITSMYMKQAVENEAPSSTATEDEIRESSNRTLTFQDGQVVKLSLEDPLYYVEEVNTQMLMQNFDIEIFEVLSSSNADSYEQLKRKYFRTKIPQIKNGFMVYETPQSAPAQDLTTDHIEYYFDVLIDSEVDQSSACKAARVFNKKSYYVDLDFDCTETEEENVFYDIYGSVTEPEVCLD